MNIQATIGALIAKAAMATCADAILFKGALLTWSPKEGCGAGVIHFDTNQAPNGTWVVIIDGNQISMPTEDASDLFNNMAPDATFSVCHAEVAEIMAACRADEPPVTVQDILVKESKPTTINELILSLISLVLEDGYNKVLAFSGRRLSWVNCLGEDISLFLKQDYDGAWAVIFGGKTGVVTNRDIPQFMHNNCPDRKMGQFHAEIADIMQGFVIPSVQEAQTKTSKPVPSSTQPKQSTTMSNKKLTKMFKKLAKIKSNELNITTVDNVVTATFNGLTVTHDDDVFVLTTKKGDIIRDEDLIEKMMDAKWPDESTVHVYEAADLINSKLKPVVASYLSKLLHTFADDLDKKLAV